MIITAIQEKPSFKSQFQGFLYRNFKTYLNPQEILLKTKDVLHTSNLLLAAYLILKRA